MDDAPRLLAGFLLISLSLAVYFTPTLVAFGREHYNRGAIFVLNLLLGWTLFGWVAALVWAFCLGLVPAVDESRLRPASSSNEVALTKFLRVT